MSSFIDHVSIPVRDLKAAGAFYDPVLATLGLCRRKEREGAIGYGPDPIAPPIFWILGRVAQSSATPGIGLHIGFRAKNRIEVRNFHAVALKHGGKDAGEPGSRPLYAAGFFGCFVLDLDGFKIEAVVRESLSGGG
ncbi:catechol 2,3-dioxygenase-like lactoylglutathione lyase family enzyme [Rhodoligotrophos appendicifer]|uniref:VOC family protein n=1 Tax=Rhodoligotrophos appendicifer TaxID=987056 RepID=UPI00117DC677|nr:VOC family protein [Rhodoligotrophos appendicifer]